MPRMATQDIPSPTVFQQANEERVQSSPAPTQAARFLPEAIASLQPDSAANFTPASLSKPLLGGAGEHWARSTLKRMSLEQKIGQMLMIWVKSEFINVDSPEYQQLRNTVRSYHIGAIGVTVPADGGLLKKSSPYETAALTNRLQRDSELPLIFAADFERGVPMRLSAGTVFPHAMAFAAAGNTNFAFLSGKITATEARALGIHWNFYPVADVNSNPLNPIINARSFGEDPVQAGDMVAAYIAGAHGMGMLTTAKHFPGHGDGDTDTHLTAATIKADRQRLERVELAPFRAAIAAGVDSVMVAHVMAPALDPRRLASLSPVIVGDVLKKQMGFRGLVVTDAMEMGALTSVFSNLSPQAAAGRAAVEAVKAGEDMLVGVVNVEPSYRALLEAVRRGEISESRIDESVVKILRAKASLGLNKSRLVDMEAISRLVGRPENQAIAQQIADASVTLVRDNGRVLPLAGGVPNMVLASAQKANGGNGAAGSSTLAVVFTDSARGDSGRLFERWLRARLPSLDVYYVDEWTAAWLAPRVMKAVERAKVVIAPVYAAPTAGSPQALEMGARSSELLRTMLAAAAGKTVVLAMGTPYLAARYPEIQNYLCLYSTVEVSEISAVKALFGEIPLTGTLPVTIPNYAPRGGGLRRAAGGQRP